MNLHGVNASVRHWRMFIIAIAGSIAFSAPVAGQSVGDPAKVQMQEMDRREMQLNNPNGNGGQPNDPKRSQAMMDQVSEDFQRILTLHNGIDRAISTNRPLNDRFISDAASEIKKAVGPVAILLEVTEARAHSGKSTNGIGSQRDADER